MSIARRVYQHHLLADGVLGVADGVRFARFTTLDVLGNTVGTARDDGEGVQAGVVVLLAGGRAGIALVACVKVVGAEVLADGELRCAGVLILGGEAGLVAGDTVLSSSKSGQGKEGSGVSHLCGMCCDRGWLGEAGR